MSNKQFSIQPMEQRKSQVNFFNFMEKERRDSKEFVFHHDNMLHRRRPSAADVHSGTGSEEDEIVLFEVNVYLLSVYALNKTKIQFPIFLSLIW